MPPLFPVSSSSPGYGNIHLKLLPPSIPSFSTLSYTYPLKLLPSTSHILSSSDQENEAQASVKQDAPSHPDSLPNLSPPTLPKSTSVPLVFVLTYGGGLLAGDSIDLNICLDPCTRLAIATQGSTKVFKTPALSSNGRQNSQMDNIAIEHAHNSPSTSQITQKSLQNVTSRQNLRVQIGNGAGLWLGLDPIQPFAGSLYEQTQIFEVEKNASLGAIDWVSEGRRARGESWGMDGWRGRNEIWGVIPAIKDQTGNELRQEQRMLMVRDSVILHPDSVQGGIAALVANAGVFGTLLLYGPLFSSLSAFFVSEFGTLPRIGGRNWGSDEQPMKESLSARQRWRTSRLEKEKADGVLWTAAKVRGGVMVVKFAAREVEGGRSWLGAMLSEEGTVGREFGEGGLMFVR